MSLSKNLKSGWFEARVIGTMAMASLGAMIKSGKDDLCDKNGRLSWRVGTAKTMHGTVLGFLLSQQFLGASIGPYINATQGYEMVKGISVDAAYDDSLVSLMEKAQTQAKVGGFVLSETAENISNLHKASNNYLEKALSLATLKPDGDTLDNAEVISRCDQAINAIDGFGFAVAISTPQSSAYLSDFSPADQIKMTTYSSASYIALAENRADINTIKTLAQEGKLTSSQFLERAGGINAEARVVGFRVGSMMGAMNEIAFQKVEMGLSVTNPIARFYIAAKAMHDAIPGPIGDFRDMTETMVKLVSKEEVDPTLIEAQRIERLHAENQEGPQPARRGAVLA